MRKNTVISGVFSTESFVEQVTQEALTVGIALPFDVPIFVYRFENGDWGDVPITPYGLGTNYEVLRVFLSSRTCHEKIIAQRTFRLPPEFAASLTSMLASFAASLPQERNEQSDREYSLRMLDAYALIGTAGFVRGLQFSARLT